MSYLSISSIPLALYIHIPWCVRKCPYCDFNSHEMKGDIDFDGYVDVLLADARSQLAFVQGRQISSVFIGGGTPSLLPIQQYQRLFSELKRIYPFADTVEVTMEANPATIEHAPFDQYLQVGINRLSIGVQTFNSQRLQTLGRIHDAEQARVAVRSARQAGFQRINVDLMHGLPKQSVEEAVYDIEQALEAGATHLSWYQLTIEPNTVFYRNQPTLPDEDVLADIEEQGSALLIANGFTNYEVSAWQGDKDTPCRHNLNYWQFGDYLAIGAGGHGKVSLQGITGHEDGIYRFSKSRLPKDYVSYGSNSGNSGSESPKMINWQAIPEDDIAGEFMLDSLRLTEGVPISMFTKRTGLMPDVLEPQLTQFRQQGLLVADESRIQTTELGRRYLNRVLEGFVC